MTEPVLFWFRRDLRVADNPALAEAAATGPVVPVFVFDESLTTPAGANRLAFLHDSLAELALALGGGLVVRAGQPESVLHELADSVGATRVFATDDHGRYGRARDTRVGEFLAGRGITTSYRSSNYVIPPGVIKTNTGTPYKVFTPFYRKWLETLPTAMDDARFSGAGSADRAEPEPVPTLQAALAAAPAVPASLSQELADHKRPDPSAPFLPPAGETAAWARVDEVAENILATYNATRNLPAQDGTSRLSPYLKWGTLHPRQIIDALGDQPGAAPFIRQLCWRDFYAEVLFNRPDSVGHPYVAANAVEADEGPEAEERFGRWCRGETGYPIVDAGMRQLLAEGWMHNRVRMIAASFLIKDLHLRWQWGAQHFMRHLVDGDVASNSHGWQWVAGTGTDASPYYRIFNPTTQSAKFDPDGAYIQRWIPELKNVLAPAIHAPTGGLQYPAPMVDHAKERLEALARYERRPANQ